MKKLGYPHANTSTKKDKRTQLAACKLSKSYKTIEITNPHQKSNP